MLLLGTALASTFLLASVAAPTQAQAQATCVPFNGTGPAPIELLDPGDSIICINTEPRTGDAGAASEFAAIELTTDGADETILLDTSGPLNTNAAADDAYGIFNYTGGEYSDINIVNIGDVTVSAAGTNFRATGISAETFDFQSRITITSRGDIIAIAPNGSAYGIDAYTYDGRSPIEVYSNGRITASGYEDAYGMRLRSDWNRSPITVDNRADITATAAGTSGDAYGIFAESGGEYSDVTITNRGTIVAMGGYYATGIVAQTRDIESSIDVTNSGAMTIASLMQATGIYAQNFASDSPISIRNTGDMRVTSQEARAFGIYAESFYSRGFISIENRGNFTVTAPGSDAYGIFAKSGYPGYPNRESSPITIENHGDLTVTSQRGHAHGIYTRSYYGYSEVTIRNSGTTTIKSNGADVYARGIYARASDWHSRIKITNSGVISVEANGAGSSAYGIDARSSYSDSPITIDNRGPVTVTARNAGGVGIQAESRGSRSSIDIANSGALTITGESSADGIFAQTFGSSSGVTIVNRGNLTVVSKSRSAYGIIAESNGPDSPIRIDNSGDVLAKTSSNEHYAAGIVARSFGLNGPIAINNAGSVYAEGPLSRGILVNPTYSRYANRTTITNTGTIGASSHLAIDVQGAGTAHIYNTGLVTGFVELTDQNDTFENQAGGVFETKKTSQFGGGNDVFVNEAGGTILGASNGNARESSGFQGLETFRNVGGTISLLDGGVGDKFTLANTPGDAGLNFEGGGFLAVDANLAGPGSIADTLIVDGNVSGVTEIAVNNASALPGALNREGIPVVYVTGATPGEGNFVLADGPLDAGFFDYDLFFEPTGSGQWELRSFVGGSAQALPKLLTAAQDMWRQTSATWFDRTADLRVVLNGGGTPGGALGYDPGSKGLVEAGPNGLTPAVWMKGGGGRLDRDGSATTSAYGRTYTYDLDNEFSTFDLQVGVDMGQYDVISQGDVLVFGVLGGFVGGKLDYDSLGDTFDFSGGQVGAYATYLKGGLFADTLLNVHLYEINTPNLGFPDSLNATTVGLRSDAGYRFGSFTEGLFFEPLATIEVTWADIDGFNVGGNRVSFSDDANVRGRIGGRVGTTMQAWEGTTMEPFLIASLWGNLSEDNSARLVSSGTTFNFNDDLDDVWGEISGGVNLFNFSQTTAVFAKVDYTFGEDVQGVGGKAGVRVAW